MWPWGHAALGYLLYVVYFRVRKVELPLGRPLVVLLVATQLPDLVDKPLAWYVGVLPYGRTLMHSLLLGGVLVALLTVFLYRRGETQEAAALAIGYYSHLLGDSYTYILDQAWANLAFLMWPLLPIPAIESEVVGIGPQLRRLELTPPVLLGILLFLAGLVVWGIQMRRRMES
jgi:membrane-bound metal-dependent hydrolase YbcI (DUF457 family)